MYEEPHMDNYTNASMDEEYGLVVMSTPRVKKMVGNYMPLWLCKV